MNEILELLRAHGAGVVFVVSILEQVGAPVPAIPVIIVAAAIAATTGGSLGAILVLAIAGALVGDLIWFLLGRRFGYRVLSILCRISLSPDSCVRKTEGFFDRWGLVSLLFAKFLPGFSTIAPALAGAIPRSSFLTFLIFDAIGAFLWSGTAILVGFVFRNAIGRVLEALSNLGGWALILLVGALALFVLIKWWERRRFYKALRLARISVQELHERMNAGGQVVLLDVRSASAQERDPARIPGALMVQAEDIEETLRNVDRDDEIILYCT